MEPLTESPVSPNQRIRIEIKTNQIESVPDDETTHIRPPVSAVYRNYVVVADDMGTFTGDFINGCQVIYTSAKCVWHAPDRNAQRTV